MSLSRLVIPCLDWAELLYVLSYLSTVDIYKTIAQVNRSGWLLYQRELTIRKSMKCKLNHSILLSKYDAHDKVLLVSYPRSGNSYLRQILENNTNITTGSDSRPNRTLSKALIDCGLKGEGITTNSVWIVKSHYPERLGFIKLSINRIILLVRNPFDAITSYFHMCMTNTHDKILSHSTFESLRHIYSDLINNDSKIWTQFIDFWLLISKSHNIPIIIIRYEDLLNEKKFTTAKLKDFLLSGNPPIVYKYKKSCYIEEKSTGYKPKNNKIGKSLDVMSVNDINIIIKHTGHYLTQFGYQIENNSIDNPDNKFSLKILPYNDSAFTPSKFTTNKIRSFMKNNNLFKVNDLFTIRDNDDKFGRKMTDMRRSLTDNDKNPFPILI